MYAILTYNGSCFGLYGTTPVATAATATEKSTKSAGGDEWVLIAQLNVTEEDFVEEDWTYRSMP